MQLGKTFTLLQRALALFESSFSAESNASNASCICPYHTALLPYCIVHQNHLDSSLAQSLDIQVNLHIFQALRDIMLC